ncbi:immunity protein YezG family protein [Weizmannia sp. FSL W8-1119]|uniref:immunity protein YezG family protein n=1 Tax=Heyndrickxia TaxID=2837504 RepID=UPI0030F96A6F
MRFRLSQIAIDILKYIERLDAKSRTEFFTYGLVYSLKIEENFKIDKHAYNELENLLYDYCEELWNEFAVQEQEQSSCHGKIPDGGRSSFTIRFKPICYLC